MTIGKEHYVDLVDGEFKGTKSGAYPLFFYWNSGALSVLAHNLDEVGKEPVFWRLVRRLALLLAGKLAEKPGARVPKIHTETIKDVPEDPKELLEWTRQREPVSRDDVADLSSSQRNQIERECLDYMIPINERHLRQILRSWASHYNR